MTEERSERGLAAKRAGGATRGATTRERGSKDGSRSRLSSSRKSLIAGDSEAQPASGRGRSETSSSPPKCATTPQLHATADAPDRIFLPMCEPTAMDHLQADAALSDVDHSLPAYEPRERRPERPPSPTRRFSPGTVRVESAGSRRRHRLESGSQRRRNCESANTLGAEPTGVGSASPHRRGDTGRISGTQD